MEWREAAEHHRLQARRDLAKCKVGEPPLAQAWGVERAGGRERVPPVLASASRPRKKNIGDVLIARSVVRKGAMGGYFLLLPWHLQQSAFRWLLVARGVVF